MSKCPSINLTPNQSSRASSIAWQGDPSVATDYMAATAMTDFPAKKLVAVIQRLKQAGLYVNLMAHSLGNGVLMNTLNRLAQDDTAVDHVFLWEAAIPDNSWDEQTHDYFPMAMSSSSFPHPSSSFPRRRESSATGTKDESSANQSGALPYDYNYPYAHQAVQQATVLYSGEDTILGASTDQTTQDKQQANQPLTPQQLLQQLINDSLGLIVAEYIPFVHADADNSTVQRLIHKVNDPGAGLMYALPNLVLSLIDQHGIQGYEDTLPQLRSIYHLANWFVYPLSYFLTDIPNRCQSYYQSWQQYYQTWQPPNGSQQVLPETLDEQKQALKQRFPKLFQQLNQLVTDTQDLVDHPDKADPYITTFFHQIINGIEHELDQHMPGWVHYLYNNPVTDTMQLGYEVTVGAMQKVVADLNPLNRAVKSEVSHEFNQKLVQKFAQKYLQSPLVKAFLQHYEDLVTVVLTVLMTPQAEPKPAMGHNGPKGDKARHMDQDLDILHSDPQKDNQGNSVCLDHSAMLVPSDKMKKFVYKKYLFGDQQWSFQEFGNYLKE